MEKMQSSRCLPWLLFSLFLNIFFFFYILYAGGERRLSWSRTSAEEAELLPKPFHVLAMEELIGMGWFLMMENGFANATHVMEVQIAHKFCLGVLQLLIGWHRMSYTYNDQTFISAALERQIRKLHETLGNAVTSGRHIVFGAGSTQLLNAAVYALSSKNSVSRSKVVASKPYYGKKQTKYFESVHYDFQGEAALWRNNTDADTNVIEFVTSPNNPDGKMNKAVLRGKNVKAIYDSAYYWPSYTAISAPADEDLMIFTISKFTGHAGSRFGWALIKDKAVFKRMLTYVSMDIFGVSRDTQLRVLKLLKVVLQDQGGEFFEFAYEIMKDCWERLRKILSASKRFSLQETTSQFCNFLGKMRQSSPAYAWLKCEREEDENCYEVLKSANIAGIAGNFFGSEDRYVPLSMINRQDDFELLLHYLNILVSEEN